MSAPVIVVTTTATRVPAQVATASLATGFRDSGLRVAVLALAGGDTLGSLVADAVEATGAGRLPVVVQAAGVAAAARREGVDLVLLHAPLGLLAPLDASNASLLDLVAAVTALDVKAGVVVATTPDDDALGHCPLVASALRPAGIDLLGVVVVGHEGPWPDAARLEDLTGAPLLGTTPPGAHEWTREQVSDRAGAWLPLE